VSQPPESSADAALAEPSAVPVPEEISAALPVNADPAVQVAAAPLPASAGDVGISTAASQLQARRVVYPVAVPSIPDQIAASSIEPGRAATTAPVEP
jgi:hypothetical protein